MTSCSISLNRGGFGFSGCFDLKSSGSRPRVETREPVTGHDRQALSAWPEKHAGWNGWHFQATSKRWPAGFRLPLPANG